MRRVSLITLVLSIALLGALFSVKGASAAINRQISFQGKLTNTDGTNVTDGSYSIRFRIYTDPTADAANTCAANSCKWEETQATVAVAGGLFQVNLGGGTSLPGSVDFNTSALYLGIKVGSDNEMTPRIQLTAAPYAMNADLIDGIDGASLVQLSPGSQQTGNINVSGTITSGAVNGLTLTQAADGFTVAGGSTSRTLTVQGANITIGSTIQPTNTGALAIQSNGANALNLDTGGASSINIGVNGTSVNGITIGNATSNPNIGFNGSGTFDTTTGATTLNGNTTITGTKTLTVTGGLTTLGAGLTFSGTAARTISGPATGGLTVNVTGGPLTVSTTTSGALAINSAGILTLQGVTGVGITSTSGNITLGTVDGTGTVLVLDTKNNTGDPTEVDGGMYYNSANNRFRCGQNGTWLNCIGGTMTTNTAASTAVNTCTTACAAFSTTAAMPANFCVPGRVFHVIANGVYSTTASTTLAMGVYLGSNATTKTSDILLGASSGALSSGAAVTNIGWGVDFYVSCFTAGASGTVSGQGSFSMATSATANAAGGRMYSSATTTINTTTAQTLYLFPAFGASAAGNTATVQQFIVTAL